MADFLSLGSLCCWYERAPRSRGQKKIPLDYPKKILGLYRESPRKTTKLVEKPLKRMKQLSRICEPFSSFTNYKAKVVSPNSHFTEKIYYNICPIFRFATRLATSRPLCKI